MRAADCSPVISGFPKCAASVQEWLEALNLARHAPTLADAGITQPSQLSALDEDVLRKAGVLSPGVRRRLVNASAELRSREAGSWNADQRENDGGIPTAPPAPFRRAARSPQTLDRLHDHFRDQ